MEEQQIEQQPEHKPKKRRAVGFAAPEDTAPELEIADAPQLPEEVIPEPEPELEPESAQPQVPAVKRHVQEIRPMPRRKPVPKRGEKAAVRVRR